MSFKEMNEIMKWVYKVNGMGARAKRTTGNLPTVFATFWGHIGTLEIHVHESGWEADTLPDRRFCFNIGEPLLWSTYCEYDDYMEELYERTF